MTSLPNHYVEIPGLIDSHVHFRTPGLSHKESWETGARAALAGGIVAVFDMPNTLPPTNTKTLVEEKKKEIEKELERADLPLKYALYLGADASHFDQISACHQEVIALKIFMGSSTGGLVMEKRKDLEEAFRLCSEKDLLIAVHAESEALIRQRSHLLLGQDPRLHSLIRNEEVAARAVSEAIELARKYHHRLHLLHISTEEELRLIAQAKEEGVPVTAETTPHHLFLSLQDYERLGTLALVNPPLRHSRHQTALWEAVRSGLIDTIGSDHAPHTLKEKESAYPSAPSGFPGVQTTLPLLLNAMDQGLLSLEDIVRLMHTNPQKIFRFQAPKATLTLDLNLTQTLTPSLLHSKAGWSPYSGWTLKGWPVTISFEDKTYDCRCLESYHSPSLRYL